jgi:hypothetical protein
MTWILALRTLMSRPVRTAVLMAGFGLGVAVTAALLGVAAVILEQARTPELSGGGDVIIDGASGRLANAKLLLSVLQNDRPLASRVAAAAPIERGTLYLVDNEGATAVRARGGIPSLERAMGDPETASISTWIDTPGDAAWARAGLDDVLREMDRFHKIPDVNRWAESWAEWLYFNARTGDAGFYLSFIAGPHRPSGRRQVGVRLQLEHSGGMTSYSDSMEIDSGVLLQSAPNLTLGRNQVQLSGFDYRIRLDLPAEQGSGRATGELVLHAAPGRFLPPLALRGAGGWISGYVVPVMAGSWQGSLVAQGRTVQFDDAAGYHDHNWGFWEGVTWQWGQVQGSGLSFVYGRVRPPAAVADPDRVPAFLMVLGRDGPVGHSLDVTITEIDRVDEGAPRRILVRGESEAFDVAIEIDSITSTVRSRLGAEESNLQFLQMRGEAHVTGAIRGDPIEFSAPASAETFRTNR